MMFEYGGENHQLMMIIQVTTARGMVVINYSKRVASAVYLVWPRKVKTSI